MKKLTRFAIALPLIAVLLLPGVSSAQSVQSASSLQSQINALLAQVKILQAQLVVTGGSIAATAPATITAPAAPIMPTPTSATWCYSFTTNLSIGMSGSVVTALQTALQRNGEVVSITGIFDNQTSLAVTEFQQKYASQVLAPAGLNSGTGYVGQSTRAELNTLFGCSPSVPVTPQPVVPISTSAPTSNPVPAPTPSPTPAPLEPSQPTTVSSVPIPTPVVNASFVTPTYSPGTIKSRVASFVVSAAANQALTIASITVTPKAWAVQNLKVFVNGVRFGNVQPTVTAFTPFTFGIGSSSVQIPAGETAVVDVYEDILGNATPGTYTSPISLTGISGSSNFMGSVAGQNVIVSSVSGPVTSQPPTPAPSLSVSLNTALSPVAGSISMGTLNNTLGAYNFVNTSVAENIKVTQMNVVDVVSPANALLSFNNLTLWNGATQIGGSANYVGTTVVNGQNAFVYSFQFGNASNFIIPEGATLPLVLKGSANAYTAGNTTDGSSHSFGILAVNGVGQTSNQTVSAMPMNVIGAQQTVTRNGAVISAGQLGASTNRLKSVNDQLGTVTFAPSNSGSLALNVVTVNFSGITVPVSSTKAMAFASSVYLLLNGTQYVPASTNCTGPTACTVTWNFGAGVNGFQVNGGPVTFTLVANDYTNTRIVAPGVVGNLVASIAANSSVQYTDGTDSNSTTLTNLSLSPSVITPIQIFNVDFVPGT